MVIFGDVDCDTRVCHHRAAVNLLRSCFGNAPDSYGAVVTVLSLLADYTSFDPGKDPCEIAFRQIGMTMAPIERSVFVAAHGSTSCLTELELGRSSRNCCTECCPKSTVLGQAKDIEDYLSSVPNESSIYYVAT